MTLIIFLAVLGIVTVIAALNYRYYRIMRNGEWHAKGDIMVRYVGGEWQQREMNKKESVEDDNRWAW